jgi:hypothetical protein
LDFGVNLEEYQNLMQSHPWWLKPVILATAEAEIRRIMI